MLRLLTGSIFTAVDWLLHRAVSPPSQRNGLSQISLNMAVGFASERCLKLALLVGTMLLSSVIVDPCVAADDDKKALSELAQYYGFAGLELYKLEERAFNLAAGDFDSDGHNDLLVVDNRASCLRLFRQKAQGDADERTRGRYVNDLESDWRFDVRQIPVDKQIAGMVVDDFNSDGRVDVAYVGTPDRLVLRYQPEAGRTEWTERWSVRLPDLVPAAWMISSGDLNADGLADIAVLGKNYTYLIYQTADATMKAPERLINTSDQLSLLQIADVDGDGRNDLVYQANNGSTRGLCARLQTADGRLGPELCFDLEKPRAVTLHDIDGQPGREVLTVDSRSGRVVVSAIRRQTDSAGKLPSRLLQYGIGESAGSRGRALGIGDIDGDQLNDLVITDPETAQVLVYRQNGIDGLGAAETFPGLLDATDLCVADVDGDSTSEVILCSDKEAAIAVSRFQGGRLTFPQTVAKPPEGFELAAMIPVKRPSNQELVVCMKKGSGARTEVQLHRFVMQAGENWSAAAKPLSLSGDVIGTRGVSLRTIDVDQDGTQEVLVIPNGTGNKGVVLVRLGTTADEESVVMDPLNLGHSSPGELFVNAGALFVAREAFARRMQFEDKTWTVSDQFNAGESRARIAGVAVLDLTESESAEEAAADSESTQSNDDAADKSPAQSSDAAGGGDEVVLVDIGIRKLRVLSRESGLYRPWKEVDLGTFNFSSCHVADVTGDGREDLVLFGNQQFSVLASGGLNVELKEIATFESDRDDAYAADIIAGDLNHDGHADLAVIDTSIDGIQLLNFDAEQGLRAVTHFRVFEEKRLVTDSESRGTEPREGLVADVTGDGRQDLILLCHDRLILYPQDSGQNSQSEAADQVSQSGTTSKPVAGAQTAPDSEPAVRPDVNSKN